MAFLFGRNKQRVAMDLCRSTRELLIKLNAEEPTPPKVVEELARNLAQMKLTMQGTPEQETSPQAVHQLVEYLALEDVLYPLATSLHKLDFDSRKDAQTVFSCVFRFKPQYAGPQHTSTDPLILPHIVNDRPEIMVALCEGYNYRASAMPCGHVLREAIKHDSMAALILYNEPIPEGQKSQGLKGVNPNVAASGRGVFWKFFDWIDKGLFEVQADAFSTFSELLRKHKKLIQHYLMTNYDLFTTLFNNKLLQSTNYVTKRQALKLLSELLLERLNYDLMTAYIGSAVNLKIAMGLLKDNRRMVNYEAFHIWKIFVANPSKTEEVTRIFVMNREKLLQFLPGFNEDREEDMQFKDEKSYCIRMIEALPSAPGNRVPTAGSAGAGGGPVVA